jgi:aspartyl-tRNA(Asn)/glutamyl-tRNA(Gln) amidotransferase subunit A
MTLTDLHYLGATEVLRAYRSRELSPVEVLDAVIARADAVEPTVNALLERDHEDYRAAAVAAAERYAGTGDAPRALEGLPVALKEEQPIAGRSLRFGSLLTEGWVSEETHPVAERVLAAGALVHARTTTPGCGSSHRCPSRSRGTPCPRPAPRPSRRTSRRDRSRGSTGCA